MKPFHLAILILLIFQVNTIHSQQEHFVESEGVKNHYKTIGNGPPVLVINDGQASIAKDLTMCCFQSKKTVG